MVRARETFRVFDTANKKGEDTVCILVDCGAIFRERTLFVILPAKQGNQQVLCRPQTSQVFPPSVGHVMGEVPVVVT